MSEIGTNSTPFLCFVILKQKQSTHSKIYQSVMMDKNDSLRRNECSMKFRKSFFGDHLTSYFPQQTNLVGLSLYELKKALRVTGFSAKQLRRENSSRHGKRFTFSIYEALRAETFSTRHYAFRAQTILQTRHRR